MLDFTYTSSPYKLLLFWIESREVLLPRYDYKCGSCELVFEVKQSFSSEPVTTCPDCMNVASRLIHSVPVVFKGSGFYVNDYGKGSSPSGSSKNPKESPSKQDESGNKGESEASSATNNSAKDKKTDT